MKPLAVDLMGGDNAPGVVIEGIRRVADELSVPIIAVGTADALSELGTVEGVETVCATEVIDMHDDPASSVRRKRDSSLVRCAELVKEGRAAGMFSAGNTGATMASALIKIGRVKRLARPAIATTIPVPGAVPTILLDAGANADVMPKWLVQFAVMGSKFSSERFGVQSPRVGLLSIGEEDTKGNALVKETFHLLKADRRINFIGNVEGRDVMTDTVDVVVTDGFTGNVVLKALEGGMRAFAKAVLSALGEGEDGTALMDVVVPKLLPLIAQMSPDTYGGAALLGINGLCLIGHGSSSSDAIFNAIALGQSLDRANLVGHIEEALAEGDASEEE